MSQNLTEEWRAVYGYTGKYEVSNLDRMEETSTGYWRRRYGRVLMFYLAKKKYPALMLAKNRTRKGFKIHILVARAFIGPCPRGKELNHIDGVTTNARANNLEYLTHQQNMDHAIANGLIDQRGSGNGNSKLKNADVLEIRSMSEAGESRAVLSKKFGVTVAMIAFIVKRINWTHI